MPASVSRLHATWALFLKGRARDILSGRDRHSTGEHIFQWRRAGGDLAGRIAPAAIGAGQPADFFGLDLNSPALCAQGVDRLRNSWVFSSGGSAIDCVWRRGTKVVSNEKHVARRSIVRRYRDVMEKMLA